MIKRELVQTMKGSEKYIGLSVFWQWLALTFQMIAVVFMGVFIENSYYSHINLQNIVGVLAAVVFSIKIKHYCNIKNTKASYMASFDVKSKLRKKIFDKIISLGSSYRQKVSTSEIIQLAVEGVEQLEVYYSKYLPQLFYSIIAPLTLFVFFAFFSLKTAIILIICVPIIPISIILVQKIAKKLLGKYWGIYTEMGDSFLENIQGLTTLKIYKADEMKTEQMDKEAENFRKITMRVLIMQLNSISVMDLVAYAGAGIGSIVAVLEFVNGRMQLWQVITIVLLAAEFFIPLRLLGSFFHIAMNGMAASDKIFSFLNIENNNITDNKIQITDKKIDIEIKSLTFAYNNKANILSDISIDIRSGNFISIVGVSGSGKSTIASLITGKYNDFIGEININGEDIRNIDDNSLKEKIVKVGYNSYIFGGTVRENLEMSSEHMNENQMIEVLKKVNLWEFLSNEDGLDTKISEQGMNLSGGQRQRLAIARALIKDSPVYIFDEASSNIDVESENIIMGIIKELAKDKTVLLISHRLDNVIESDSIYLLKDGKIEEKGTHNQLMNLKKNYYNMFTTQRQLCEKWEASNGK